MARAAAGRFIGVGTELGGKDPSYVRADADLELAIAENAGRLPLVVARRSVLLTTPLQRGIPCSPWC